MAGAVQAALRVSDDLNVRLNPRMAYNHGRPLLMTDDDTLINARKLLSHPLSHLSDSRLVASCELLALRSE